MTRYILTLFAVLCALACAEAQPVISAVTGEVSNNKQIVISGQGFGTKAQAGPRAYEDFEDGQAQQLDANHFTSAMMSNTSDGRHPFSTRNARGDYASTSGSEWFFAYENGTAPVWYVEYNVKLASGWQWGNGTSGTSGEGLANIKMFRMFPTGSRSYSNVGYSLHGFAGFDTMRFTENGAQPYIDKDYRQFFSLGGWHKVQIEYVENSGLGQANGRIKLMVDGKVIDDYRQLVTNASGDGAAVNKRPYNIGFYNSWGRGKAGSVAFYDDIYVDMSVARVEIGNASTYNACTLRETAVPTAWSNGSVTATVKQGALANGSQAWVYVIDSNGQPSVGFPVLVGSATQPPATPSVPVGFQLVVR